MAFVLAGIVAVLSLGLGFLGMMASGMSDAPGQTSGVAPYVVGGLLLAACIAGSHWLPRIGW